MSPLALLVFRLANSVTGTPRPRVLVRSKSGQVLLVKGVLSSGKWSLPGGGAKRGETMEQAAKRELYEETGIKVKNIEYIGRLTPELVSIHYVAPLFKTTAETADLPLKPHNPLEIAEIAWFDADKLPKDLSNLAEYVLKIKRY